MQNGWTSIWRSRRRATLAGLLISAVIASVLYAFNWHTFYSTRSNLAQQRATRIFADIHAIALHTASHPDHDQVFRDALRDYADHRRARITVSRLAPQLNGPSQAGAAPLWQQSNDIVIDQRRTLMDSVQELDDPGEHSGGEVGGRLRVQVEEAIRPPLYLALARAWSFSILDYLDDPQRWHDDVLYNRSLPLYGYFITILLVGFGTIRAFHRDQIELDRLQADASDAAAELDRQHRLSQQQIEQLREQHQQIQQQQQQAEQQQQRLETELQDIEDEYRSLLENAPGSDQDSDRDDSQRLQANQQRRSSTLEALASYNHSIAQHRQQAERAHTEMLAAEQLLSDVEQQRSELSNKVRSRNREVQRLRSLLKDIEKNSRNTPASRVAPANTGPSAIEQQLSLWISNPAGVSMKFSQHHGVGELEQQAAKVDRAFLDRYFSHVTNPEYGRGAHKTIRVVTDGDNSNSGELIVALDDKKRRTLGFRYQTRNNAPPAVHVGFVLALLLRQYCRDFRDFSIRLR